LCINKPLFLREFSNKKLAQKGGNALSNAVTNVIFENCAAGTEKTTTALRTVV
jgi:hypothetical protein